MPDPVGRFLKSLDGCVAAGRAPAAMAAEAARLLPELVGEIRLQPSALAEQYRESSPDRYAQHVVHVGPSGRYSLVALVWRPGQRTPVHDHRCWCVVGVLEGRERETTYHLHCGPDGRWLSPQRVRLNDAGQVSTLVPPAENIHQVENAGADVAVSLHVYGADIRRLGTSINHIFTEPIREDAPGGADTLSWRASVGQP